MLQLFIQLYDQGRLLAPRWNKVSYIFKSREKDSTSSTINSF